MAAKERKKRLNFEASLKKLEQIVNRLEDEQAPLEESLKLFAEGKALARACEAELRDAENRVRQLMAEGDDGGEITEAPMDAGGGASRDEPSGAPSPPKRGATARKSRDDLPF